MNKSVSILTHSFLDGYNRRFDKIFGGGLERYVYDLCSVIKDLGYQPEIHQLSYFERFESDVEGIKVFGHPYDINDLPRGFERMVEEAKGALIYASCIWHPIRYQPGSLAICHGINWDQHSLPKAEKQYVVQSIQGALDQLSKIVSVDSHFLTFCRAVCWYPDSERVVLLPNSVDTSHFVPAESKNPADPFRVLYPRRISYERGIIPMMLTADELLDEHPDLIMEFAGEVVHGSDISEAFLMWMKHHPHRDRIIHRTYSFDQVVSAYQHADIVVIPTIFSEGTSYSCLEALSCGKPVVSSNVGGLNDLILDEYNGLLVSPTEHSFTAAIRRLIKDGDLRATLGKRARETAKAFDKKLWEERWKKVLVEYLDEVNY